MALDKLAWNGENQTNLNTTTVINPITSINELIPIPYGVEGSPAVNILFIVDTSVNMNVDTVFAGNTVTRLTAAKNIMHQLLTDYEHSNEGATQVRASILNFQQLLLPWSDIISNRDIINNLTTSSTSFDFNVALNNARQAFSNSGKLTGKNVCYILTNASDTSVNEDTWKTFLNSNNIKSYGLGFGSASLDKVSWNGIDKSDMNTILVTNVVPCDPPVVTTTQNVPLPTEYKVYGSKTSDKLKLKIEFSDNNLNGSNTSNIDGTLKSVVTQIRPTGQNVEVKSLTATHTGLDAIVVFNKTYKVLASSQSVNEGSSVTFTITTENVDPGTTLYWTTSGTVSNTDFSDGSANPLMRGSFVVGNTNPYVYTLSRTIAADMTTETGIETFAIQLRTVGYTGTIEASSQTVTINDTSLTPVDTTPTYSVSLTPSTVNEGGAVSMSVITNYVSPGTVVWWVLESVSGNFDYFDMNGLTSYYGSFTIPSSATYPNNPSISYSSQFQIKADALTEGVEKFKITIRTGSASGIVVATSNDVTIADTSTTPVTTSFDVLARNNSNQTITTVNEGGNFHFLIRPNTNMPQGTPITWAITGTAANGVDISVTTDGVSGRSGSFTYAGVAKEIYVYTYTDQNMEGSETLILTVHALGQTYTASVTVIDTSYTALIPSISISSDKYSISGGDTVTITLSYTNFTQMVVIGYIVPGIGITQSDFVTAVNQDWSVPSTTTTIVGSSSRTFSITTRAESTRTSTERFNFTFKTITGQLFGILALQGGDVSIISAPQPLLYAYFGNTPTTAMVSYMEGTAAICNFVATNFTTGANIPWVMITTEGYLDNTNDFTGAPPFSGNIYIPPSTTYNTTLSFNLAVNQDLPGSNELEQEDQFKIQYTLPNGTIGYSNIVNITNSAPALNPVYTILRTSTNVPESEGSSATYTVTVTNPNPAISTLYWFLTGTVSDADLTGVSSNAIQLSGTTTTKTGSFTLNFANDALTEGLEGLIITIKTSNSAATLANIVCSYSSSLQDVSTTPPSPKTYLLTETNGKTSYNEGDTTSFTVTTTNVANGTVLNWDISGVLLSDLQSISGTVTIYNNVGVFSAGIITNDNATEGPETMVVNVKYQGSSVAILSRVINDTSTIPSGVVTFASPGSYTWVVPPSIYSIKVTIYGAGGGSGAGDSSGDVFSGGGGGAGGYSVDRSIIVNPGVTLSCTVGRGGKGASYSFNGNVSNSIDYDGTSVRPIGIGKTGEPSSILNTTTHAHLVIAYGGSGGNQNTGGGGSGGMCTGGSTGGNGTTGWKHDGQAYPANRAMGGNNGSGTPPNKYSRGSGYGNGGGQLALGGIGVDGQDGYIRITWG